MKEADIDTFFRVKGALIDDAIEEVLGGYSSQEPEPITVEQITENMKQVQRELDALERERLKAFLGFNVICNEFDDPDAIHLFVGKNVWNKLKEIREEQYHE